MTSSPADSPANQSASPEPDSPKTIRDGYGPSSSESFAWYDPDTLSWKTSQGSLLPEWEMFSETWPRSGMTVSGKAFRLRLLAPLIYGGGSSLLPTPTAHEGGRQKSLGPNAQIRPSLGMMARRNLWPTPRVSMANGPSQAEIDAGDPKRRLETAVHLWPTPTAWLGRRPAHATGNPERYFNPERSNELSDAVAVQTSGQLNPMWVEWLMGFPEGWTD